MVPSNRRRSCSIESVSPYSSIDSGYRHRASTSRRCCLDAPNKPLKRSYHIDISPRNQKNSSRGADLSPRYTEYSPHRTEHSHSRRQQNPHHKEHTKHNEDHHSSQQRRHYTNLEHDTRKRHNNVKHYSTDRHTTTKQYSPHEMFHSAEQPLTQAPPPSSNDKYAAKHCPFDKPRRFEATCENNYVWKPGKYVSDECGSGIVTKDCDTRETRDWWCRTPLSVYQATICELGRKLLCGELRIPRRIITAPPCNVCETILPPCQGYYRKYERLPACEEDYVTIKGGQKQYRNRVKRYWEPCAVDEQGTQDDITKFAGHNSYLAMKLSTKHAQDISRL